MKKPKKQQMPLDPNKIKQEMSQDAKKILKEVLKRRPK